MIRPIVTALLCLLLLPSLGHAELTVDVRKALAVQTVTPRIVLQLQTEDGTAIGKPVESTGDPVAKPAQPVAMLFVKSDRDLADSENVLVKLKCATAKLVPAETGVYVLGTPGTHRVNVVVLAQNPLAWDEVDLTITVGAGPDPGPGPGPGPEPTPPLPPNGPFDGIAAKVAVHAVHLEPAIRSQIVSVLTVVADKMAKFEFRQIEQAKTYIATNWPPCTNEHCGKLWATVFEDAAGRNLSWQETQAYYREIAKGVR